MVRSSDPSRRGPRVRWVRLNPLSISPFKRGRELLCGRVLWARIDPLNLSLIKGRNLSVHLRKGDYRGRHDQR